MGRSSQKKTFLLRQLNLFGFDHLDPIILAALADERPLLLIGPHGTAKSELLNRLAASLGLQHRHYNASLLSFDDLLGYPMPNPETGQLEFLETPASIWGAESIFLDEISRCRPETANKLFSVIHEARIQGIALPKLRYRWAAMNPPTREDDSLLEFSDTYVGSIPLDPALADRFTWVVELPPLEDLPVQARRDLITHGGDSNSAEIDLKALIRATRAAYRETSLPDRSWVIEWVDALIDPLREAHLSISGRRAVFLRESVLWVQAACRALTRKISIQNAALLALRHGLPQKAQGRIIDAEVLTGVHRAACSIAGQPVDSVLRAIRAERDPARRIALALEAPPKVLDRTSLSQLVSDVLADLPKGHRWALSLLLARHPRASRLDAPTLELLAEPVEKVVAFVSEDEHRVWASRSRAYLWNRVLAYVRMLQQENDPDQAMLGNLLYTLFAVEEEDFEPGPVVRAFRHWREILEARREQEVA